jgi:tRNA U34 5-methylaminomethyl-2-thiouridine-forming methyltransferase MnmC
LPPRGNAQRSDNDAEFAAQDAAQTESSPTLSRQNTLANRFAGARNRAGSVVQSIFGHGENSAEDDKPFENENEYDTSTVDLLDVMGKYTKPPL